MNNIRRVTVASVAVNTTAMDIASNTKEILNTMENVLGRSDGSKPQFIAFPELCLSGYGCEDWFKSIDFLDQCKEALHKTVADINKLKHKEKLTYDIFYTLGLPMLINDGIYNVIAVCTTRHGIIGYVPKKKLAIDGVHYESRFFKAWPDGVETEFDGIPCGDIMFEVGSKDGSVRIGLETCEEAWTSDRPVSRMKNANLDIVFNCSASHYAMGKQFTRLNFVSEASRAQYLCYVYSNLLGCESGRIIFDGSCIISVAGKLEATSDRFSFQGYSMAMHTMDLDVLRGKRAAYYNCTPASGASNERFVSITNMPLAKPETYYQNNASNTLTTERAISMDGVYMEVTRALCLGMFDYARKTASKGFVVSLSGGADSSMVSTIVRDMVALATQNAPEEHLNQIGLTRYESTVTQVEKILTCVYQHAKNSSSVTQNAARALAEEIGAKFLNLDISPMVSMYADVIGKSLEINDLESNYEKYDIPNQNLQARVRAPSVWMLANIKNALLLTTSNRSEVAVGYATMDGDTCGGLAPIGGLDKAFVRKYLVWREKLNSGGMRPIESLKYVNCQKPTAELRPKKYKQTDEDDLMPYHILNHIERLAIIDKMLPVSIVDKITCSFIESTYITRRNAISYVCKFFRLWCRNQWKRERYAPSFHLDEESLDPRSFCRFPILNSGMRAEIKILEEELAEVLRKEAEEIEKAKEDQKKVRKAHRNSKNKKQQPDYF